MSRRNTSFAGAALALATLFACADAAAMDGQFSLQADSAPGSQPWTAPATLDYQRTNGSSTGSIDAVLDYALTNERASKSGEAFDDYTFLYKAGPYIHRNTDPSALKDDRGVNLSFSMVSPLSKAVTHERLTLTIAAEVDWGKTLVLGADSAGAATRSDDNTDRETLAADVYYQPDLAGDGVLFFDMLAGGYSDRTSGGAATTDGRLTGGQARINANWAVLGLLPTAIPGLALSVVPTITASAQLQKDSSATGARTKDTYHLWTVALGLSFASLDTKSSSAALHPVPSLLLQRSSGADLLTGRSRSAVTELALGLTF